MRGQTAVFASDIGSREEMKDNIKNEEKLDKDLKVKLGDSLASVVPMAGLDVHNSFSRVKSVNQINLRPRSSSLSSHASTYVSELAMLFKPPR